MKKIEFLAVFVLGLFLGQTLLVGEMVHGKIQSVDTNKKSVRVSVTGGEQGLPNTLEISIGPATALKGFKSVSELKAGDEIMAEARKNNLGVWEATSVEYGQAGMKSATGAMGPMEGMVHEDGQSSQVTTSGPAPSESAEARTESKW